MSNESDPLCCRCARRQKTCCQYRDVYVTAGDVARIADHGGGTGFSEFRAPTDPEYLQQDDDPLWLDHVFRADGTRRVLRKGPDGACTFLGPAGCRLSLEVRPLVCRLYPFDYTERGLRDALAEGCPMDLLLPGRSLLEELQMSAQDARRWHPLLYDELRREESRRTE